MDNVVAVVAGQTITVGIVASSVAQLAKIHFLTGFYQRTLVVRITVAALCVLLNAAAAWLSGTPIVIDALLARLRLVPGGRGHVRPPVQGVTRATRA